MTLRSHILHRLCRAEPDVTYRALPSPCSAVFLPAVFFSAPRPLRLAPLDHFIWFIPLVYVRAAFAAMPPDCLLPHRATVLVPHCHPPAARQATQQTDARLAHNFFLTLLATAWTLAGRLPSFLRLPRLLVRNMLRVNTTTLRVCPRCAGATNLYWQDFHLPQNAGFAVAAFVCIAFDIHGSCRRVQQRLLLRCSAKQRRSRATCRSSRQRRLRTIVTSLITPALTPATIIMEGRLTRSDLLISWFSAIRIYGLSILT